MRDIKVSQLRHQNPDLFSHPSQKNPSSKQKNPALNLPKEVPYIPPQQKGSSKYALWIIAIGCIASLVFAMSRLLESAVVTITPKTIPIALDVTDVFTATKDSVDPSELSYIVMSLSGDTSISLPATETTATNGFSKGKVTMFNAYSTTPFRIVKNTPIRGTNGVLYKVDNLFYIPGYTKEDGNIVPGTIDVDVTCATSGAIGDVDSTDFSVPYFNKRPQAGKIFGRTKTPMAGGIVNVVHTIPKSSADSAYQSLKNKLRDSLISKTKVQVPDGYLFYNDATVFTTDDTVAVPTSDTKDVPVGLHGKLTSYLIKQDSLINAIVTKFVNNYNGETVSIPKISSLTFSPQSDKPLDPDNDTSINFTFDGTVKIIWDVKTEDVKNQLAGSQKASFQNILSSVAGVENANIVIKPFWKQTFPTDPERIKVNVLPVTD